MTNFKRIVAISDMHCGSRVGLTPTRFKNPFDGEDPCWQDMRQKQWDWFENEIDLLRRDHAIDYLFVLGDAVDGPGDRQKGRDVVWTKKEEQIEIAEEVVRRVGAKEIRMVAGTPYHVDDSEWILAERLGTKCFSSKTINIDGVIFNLKHKVGRGGAPGGQFTSPARAKVWNMIRNYRGEAADADIILRAHVHYHCGLSMVGNGKICHVYTLPALQGPGTLFGLEQCDGVVDFGFMHFDVSEDGRYAHQVHLVSMECHDEQVEVLTSAKESDQITQSMPVPLLLGKGEEDAVVDDADLE